LVNKNTGSSAELVAYGFQNLKLGTVIGEQTLGIVNLAEYFPVKDDLILLLSKGYQKKPFASNGI
jgi:C-terminal processing protease CtpA/Prc